MKANYSVTNGGLGSDFGDLFIPRALFSQGGLWTWGYNVVGQLGNNNITNQSSPVQTVAGGLIWKSVAFGSRSTAAIKTDGTLWTWGSNVYGQLGTNNVANRSSPVQTISTGVNWLSVTCGGGQTAAIKTDGTLWLWGRNHVGQLGTNDTVNRSSPVQTVSGGNNWKLVTGGSYYHTAAIKTDGTLWTWGYNNSGQLGTNDTTTYSSPVQTVANGTNWQLISGGALHTAAIKTDGTLWTWGYNNSGQLGDNTITLRSSPVQTISGGTNWKQVACGQYHTAAIKTDGTLWIWGDNTFGGLGTNNSTNVSSPVQTVAAGTTWKTVTSGYYHTAAIKTDGTLWTWGRNSYGKLGTNDTTNYSSPVQTVASGTNWKLVACGESNIAAITDIF